MVALLAGRRPMSFTTPWALLLLLTLPIFWFVAWPRRHRLYRVRDIASLLIRSLIILLLVLALAGMQQVQSSNELATVFLLDVSDSVGPAEGEAGLNYIRQALASMGPEDRAGVILFGADALVERLVSADTHLDDPASVPVTNYTDIAGAIRLGLTLFPDNAARRLVILSDGQANLGDARQAAQLAQASGVEVSVAPLARQTGVEVRLDDLSAPATLHAGEHFDLTVAVHSSTPMDVPLQIFSEGRLVAQQELGLQAGDNSFVLPLVAGEPGFTTFQARLVHPADTFPQNNTLDAFSEVKGPLSVLLVAEHPDEGRPLAAALQGTDLAVTEITPAELPSDLGRLSEFATLVLVNVPSFKLAPRQLELLKIYVRDVGRGLVVVGGEESYGPGGYFQTPLEETLPVDMTITDKQRLPGLTLLAVIDKSGSMSGGGTSTGLGPRKVELAKEAIYRSVDLLAPWDRLGVIGFDNAARWVLEPVPAVNIPEIKDRVGTIRAGGGTDILAGLQVAAETIVAEPSQVRHIVLLTDGGANPDGIPELTQTLAEQDVTISVVAIGEGYAPFLIDVAEIGGGRFHFAADASVIPQIFAQETSLASRSYIVEEPFTPQVAGPSPILQGFRELPPLQGYVATSPKLTAQTVLRGGTEQDPILAHWQFGLGRAVAWTSDAKGQWAAAWGDWPEFPRFWSQVVRWTIVGGSKGGLESRVQLTGEQAIVTAEVVGNDGRYRNNLDVRLNVVDPALNQQRLTLRQTAPGLYEGAFRPRETGIYLLHLAGWAGEDVVAAQTRGYVLAYSPEYRDNRADPTLLPDLAAIGHGRVLPLAEPAEAFAHTLPPARATTDLWPWLLVAAILLLPLDVAVRRVIVGREELQHLWRQFSARLPRRSTTPQPMASSAARLLKVKESARRPVTAPLSSVKEPDVEPVKGRETGRAAQPQAAGSAPGKDSQESSVRRLVRAKQKRRSNR
jgi:Mg-chelatase subunit ChlD